MATNGALGRLNVSLGLDAAEFTRGMTRAERETQKRLDSIARSARRTGNLIGAALGGITIGFAFKKLIDNTAQAENAQAQLAAVLRSTGQAAGLTQQQLSNMARTLAQSSTFSADEITEAQARLLAYSGIAGEQVPRAMQSVIDTAARMGMSLTQAAETVGRALDVPSQGMASLSRQGFRFTDDQKKLAESLEQTGRTAEAQGIVLAALESSYGGAAAAARNTFGGALKALGNSIDDLMTGDAGSLSGLTQSINTLTHTLESEETKRAFQTFISMIANTANTFTQMMAVINGSSFTGWALTSGNDQKDPAAAIAKIDDELKKMHGTLDAFTQGDALDPARHAFGFFDMKTLETQIAALEKQRAALVMYQKLLPQPIGIPVGGPPPVKLVDLTSPSTKPGGSTKGRAASTRNEDPLGVFIKDQNIDYAMDQYQQYLDFIDDATGRSTVKRLGEQKQWLSDALRAGDISYDEYAKAMDKITSKGSDTFDDLGQFGIEAARNIQDALGDGLYDLLTGRFDDIGKSWADTIARMASQAAAANLGRALFGDFGSSGKIGGLVGSLIGSLSGGGWSDAQATGLMLNNIVPSAKGNAFSGGTGLDYYRNTIVNSPTLFRFAQGGAFGGMGEAGPEAIMPLKRGADGTLGVRAQGAGDIQIVINNNGEPMQMSAPPRVTRDSVKGTIVELFVADNRVNGPMTRSLRGVLQGA